MDKVTTVTHRIVLEESPEAFEVRADLNVLAGMERAGAALIPVGCRGGGCGRCRIWVIEGRYNSKRMSRAHISEEDERCGRVLACRVFARSDLLIRLDTPQADIGV
ncbi:MAG: 2Fe-2S iron-sulfur cluster binding domain-containing protein [Oceanospirillaceae bacterium]|nr:2Fe-2S iron-sulfur cluster binding domain-containing protein [Oceanospirillaceae bacterium]